MRATTGSLVLLDLLGGVALLLWGLHMVLTGVLRAPFFEGSVVAGMFMLGIIAGFVAGAILGICS